MNDKPAAVQSDAGVFATTLWSVVSRTAATESVVASAALEQVCAAYWFPIYAYVRRQGHSPENAQDLTQQFFAHLLQANALSVADRTRGRFRTFLLSSLQNFLRNEWKKGNRVKRGGGQQLLSLDAEQTETRFRAEAADGRSPDKAFERRWAMVLLERVLDQVEAEFLAADRAPLFNELKSSLTGEQNESSYAEIAQRLGMTQSNLKVSVHRLRRRYRELLREEIGRTVDNPASVDEEMRDLMAALCD